MLDCDHGKLNYLTTLSQKHIQPLITLSSKGVIHGTEFTVVGFMERYVMFEGRPTPGRNTFCTTTRKVFAG